MLGMIVDGMHAESGMLWTLGLRHQSYAGIIRMLFFLSMLLLQFLAFFRQTRIELSSKSPKKNRSSLNSVQSPQFLLSFVFMPIRFDPNWSGYGWKAIKNKTNREITSESIWNNVLNMFVFGYLVCVCVCVHMRSINWLRRNLSALLTKFTWNWLKMPQMTIIYTSNTYFVSVSYWRSLFRNGIVADIAALGPQKPRTSVGRNVCVWFRLACEHYLCASTRVSVDIHCFLHMSMQRWILIWYSISTLFVGPFEGQRTPAPKTVAHVRELKLVCVGLVNDIRDLWAIKIPFNMLVRTSTAHCTHTAYKIMRAPATHIHKFR